MDIDEASTLCLAGKSLDVAEVMEAVSENPHFLHSRSQLSGSTFLELAVSGGNVELVSRLLLAGASPNCFQSPNDIPLVMAIRSREPSRVEIVRLLIQNGANVNAPGVLDASALHAAVAESSEELVELLLENGADINTRYPPDDFTPLWFACVGDGNEEMVRVLLAHGADYGLRNTTTSTAPLDEAIRNGNVAIVSALLEAGANPNSRGLGRETPLCNAMLVGTPNALEVVNMLLQHGADVNASGEHLASALHAAVLAAPIEFVELLLRHGANVNKRSPLDDLTPMGVAVVRDDKAIEELLLAHGAEDERNRP